MKFFIFSFVFSLCLYSAEIQRIESILEDIELLREDYLKCKQDLKLKNTKDSIAQDYKILLAEEKKKNILLISQIDLIKKNNKSEYKLKKLKNILKTKEKDINNLESEILSLKKKKEKKKKTLVITKKKETICVDENQFPQLIMKSTPSQNIEISEIFAPSVFRLSRNADIYDAVKGKVVDNWAGGDSFTSNIMTQRWMKITGYFINGIWLKSKDELWIKKENIIAR